VSQKERLSASVDADLIAAAERAVASGEADSVSAWVNAALRLKLAHDRRMAALAAFITAFEAEHGALTTDEMEAAARRARARAIAVRGPRAVTGRRRSAQAR
jgi:Arc/MetJ-type ribon-helix-helix transcriptional regulator